VRVQGNQPLRGGGGGFPIQGEQRFQELINGNIAWNLNAQGEPTRTIADIAGDRQLALWTNPAGFIQAGLAATNAAATDRYFARQNRTLKVVAFSTKVCDEPQPQCTRRITGEFNNDNMLERVVTWVPDPVLGDKMVEIRYSDYKDVGGGVKMPHRVHAHQGDHPLIPGGHNWLDLRISEIKVNVANAATPVPDAVKNAPVPNHQRVVATKLADGVVHMGGGSHHSIAVEFKDYVTVIEGPLSNQRTNAVVAEVKKTFPNKPIRYLVNTHNHFDHLGGVRGYVAEGATVITASTKDLPAGRLARNHGGHHRPAVTAAVCAHGPRSPTFCRRSGRLTISDGNQTIELYHVEGLNHSDNMTIAYLPKSKILISADLGGPPPAGSPAPANVSANSIALYRNIERLKLDVATHAPIHGNPGPHAEFARVVGPAAARAPAAGGGG
jgi:glyoxylase-like metal-dependent hydrolase (beta-lactamase superfamily II)